MPNSAFITREFMVLDDGPSDMGPGPWDRPQVHPSSAAGPDGTLLELGKAAGTLPAVAGLRCLGPHALSTAAIQLPAQFR